jgi:phenylalanyl-tRNA synthetase beta chain
MKVSYQWLRELTGVDWSVEEVADRLTLCGTACEDIVATDRYLDKVVVGEVIGLGPIKGADNIQLATVNLGEETLELVCGAPNVAVGQKVAVAQVGAKLAGDIEIKKAKIRGVESRGMICSERELGFSDDHSGILVLAAEAVPGTPLVDHLDYHDYILDFELTPNRGDSMSAVGIARDLAALAGTKVKYPRVELKTVSENVCDLFKASSEDPVACPRFTARMIRNVKIGPSPWWVQKKLIGAGMRPISNVVDVTNLVMLETGNPVHAFDLDRLGSDRIVVRRAAAGERLITLDGKEHVLTPDVLLITDGKRARAAAGVMGGFDSEVTDDTKNILLEVAHFDASVIRKSRKALGMTSEASQRFEKGVDPNNVPHASARVCQLFAELCGGEVLDGLVDFYPKPIQPPTVTLRPERCNRILGSDFTAERMVEILKSLEFEVTPGNPIVATIPTFRTDILREIDLIEEVARMAGWDAIPDAIGNIGPLFAPANPTETFNAEIRTVLTGAGFDEILGHGLADSKFAELLSPGMPPLRIINPVSEDLDIMRLDLAQTALTAIAHNLAHRNLDMKLFEIGKVYPPPDAKGNWIEEDRLLLAVTGGSAVGWRDKPRPLDFYDLKGGLEALVRHFHWSEIGLEDSEHAYLVAGQSFALKLNGCHIGSAGLVDSTLARRFGVKQPVYVLQVRLAELSEQSRDLTAFAELPVFPAASRDLAIVLDESVRVGAVIDAIGEAGGELAESVAPFDLYAGPQIGEGRKSVAVAIRYRASDRSLSSEEVDDIQARIVARLKEEFKAEIRDG